VGVVETKELVFGTGMTGSAHISRRDRWIGFTSVKRASGGLSRRRDEFFLGLLGCAEEPFSSSPPCRIVGRWLLLRGEG